MLFYDAPTPPAGMFDEFLAIPALDQNVSTRSYLSLILAAPSNGTAGLQSVPLLSLQNIHCAEPSIYLGATMTASLSWISRRLF